MYILAYNSKYIEIYQNMDAIVTAKLFEPIILFEIQPDPLESQPHRPSPLKSQLNSMTVPDLPSLIFNSHLLPSHLYTTGFSFCFFPGFLAIFILSWNSNSSTIVSIKAVLLASLTDVYLQLKTTLFTPTTRLLI